MRDCRVQGFGPSLPYMMKVSEATHYRPMPAMPTVYDLVP